VTARSATFWAAVIASGLLAVAGQLAGSAALVWVFKPLTTLLIIAAALRRDCAGAYGRAVLAGLVLSLAGDVLLIPSGMFVWGLVAFLLAHVAYLVAFTRGVRLAARWLPFVLVGVVAAGALAVLWPGVPAGLRLPVSCYVVLLAAMTAQASARAIATGDALARAAAVGGALFLASDTLLAFNRFHAPLPLASLWVLGTYWPAQALIALSVPPRRST
jgi:uncharacterized membrane protein YhhN